MNLQEYEQELKAIQDYFEINGQDRLALLTLGLAGETGETVEMIKKLLRDGEQNFDKELFVGELGDVLAYVALLASIFGFSLSDVMEVNIGKLKSRANSGTLQTKREEH